MNEYEPGFEQILHACVIESTILNAKYVVKCHEISLLSNKRELTS